MFGDFVHAYLLKTVFGEQFKRRAVDLLHFVPFPSFESVHVLHLICSVADVLEQYNETSTTFIAIPDPKIYNIFVVIHYI